jgi:ParB/RepB/Spo0J family partition protein
MNIVEPAFGNIPIELIRPSKTNPRKRFDNASLAELAKSIKQSGVGQPILVRPLPNVEDDVSDRVEIVAGERRYRASILAGLATIPAIVRDMSDAEALEFQLVENLQREDVHEIEEAEGYERLMKEHKFTADECAERVGKSRSYIYGRLKFCALAPAVRTAFYDEKLNASTALLIARIPLPSLQAQAAQEIIDNDGDDEPMSYREAVRYVQARYMLDLNKARFLLQDAKLVAAAGSCEKCPKRAGNQPEVFSDVSAYVCTDPDCFSTKTKAHDDRVIMQARKKNIPVYEGDEGVTVWEGGDHVTLDDAIDYFDRVSNDDDWDKSIDEALPAELRPEPVAYAIVDGKPEPLFDKTAIQLALEKAGLCDTLDKHTERMKEKLEGGAGGSANVKPKEDNAAKNAALKNRADNETKFRTSLYKQMRGAVAGGISLPVKRLLTKMMLDEGNLPANDLIELYDFDTNDNEAVCSFVDGASSEALDLMLLDLAARSLLKVLYWNIEQRDPEQSDEHKVLLGLAELTDVDHAKIRDEIFPKATEEEKPVSKKAKPKADKAKPAEVIKTVLNAPSETAGEPAPEEAQAETPTAAPAGKKAKAVKKSKVAPDPAAVAWPFPTGARPR